MRQNLQNLHSFFFFILHIFAFIFQILNYEFIPLEMQASVAACVEFV